MFKQMKTRAQPRHLFPLPQTLVPAKTRAKTRRARAQTRVLPLFASSQAKFRAKTRTGPSVTQKNYQIQKIHLSRKKRTKAKARAKTRMLPVLQKNQAKT